MTKRFLTLSLMTLIAFSPLAVLKAASLIGVNYDSDTNSPVKQVNLEYKEKGRFIGLIPITMSIAISLDGEGNVQFDYPWYSFLVAKSGANLDERIAAALNDHFQSSETIASIGL